jgi:hypothetical protein
MSGPAVGARGQIGISQEGVWGKKQPAPQFFIDLVSEGIASELGSLVSNALRADRAVHKRIPGVESAGGDFNVEVAAEGLGQMFKHALGSVETTRVDNAFVLKVTDNAATSALLTITTAAGLADQFTVTITGGTGSGVDLDLTSASYDTIGEVMAAINGGGTGLKAYSVVSYQGGGVLETLQASDYAQDSDDSDKLEEVTAIELVRHAGADKTFLVCFGFGAYSHQIDAAATLPPGLTMEVGRDIAAFTYNGAKVNSMTLTADTGEIFGGVFNMMAKGGTTVSRAVASSSNTGNEKNAFGIRYTGEGSTCTLDIDKTNHLLTIASDGTSEDLNLDISIPYMDALTGRVYAVHTVGGLVEYLNNLSYITCSLSDYTHYDMDSSYLKDSTTVDITGTSLVIFNFDSADLVSEPVTWGDYIGTDEGTALTFIAEIVGGGVPGTATIRFQASGGSWGDTYTTSATNPTEVRIASNVDTGFTIFFPDNTSLQAGDKWTISTFKLAETATYSALDPFAGFDGALTLDGSAQPIMGWNATVNNNLYGEKYDLGSRTRGSLPEQRRTTEGVMTVEFDNLDLYRRFVNGTSGSLQIVFTSDTYIANSDRSGIGNSPTQYSLTIVQPKVEYDGSTPLIEGEGIIEHDMPYTSLYDSENSIPDMRITIVNNTAYL